MKTAKKKYTIKCAGCGGKFLSTREDTKTCSSTCRSKKRRVKASYYSAVLTDGVFDLRATLDKHISHLSNPVWCKEQKLHPDLAADFVQAMERVYIKHQAGELD